MNFIFKKLKLVWVYSVLILPTLICGLLASTALWFDKSGQYYHAVGAAWCRMILWAAFVRVKVFGAERVKWNDVFIIVSNHQSHFDTAAIRAHLKNNHRYMAKMELANVPVFGAALKYGDDVLIDRHNRSEAVKGLDETERKLRAGRSVVIFAEGTRSETGVMKPFKPGAFKLACRTGIPVLPITVLHSQNIMPKGKTEINGGWVELVIHAPIDSTPYMAMEDGASKLSDKTRETIAAAYRP